MTTIYDDNATTWHDLTDQLTPQQIRKREDSEQGYRECAQLPKPWWCADEAGRLAGKQTATALSE